MSRDVTQPTDPSSRQCCCTSRSGAILSYSPSQCQKKDLQNILGCISCADSDLMSPVRSVYASREFQPRRMRFSLCNSPPCFLNLPLAQCSSFVGLLLPPPAPNGDWQQTGRTDPHSPTAHAPFHAGSAGAAHRPRTGCSAAAGPAPRPPRPRIGLGPRDRAYPSHPQARLLWSSCWGKFAPYSEPVERHPGKLCGRREAHNSWP